jgi:hypothetical protein
MQHLVKPGLLLGRERSFKAIKRRPDRNRYPAQYCGIDFPARQVRWFSEWHGATVAGRAIDGRDKDIHPGDGRHLTHGPMALDFLDYILD